MKLKTGLTIFSLLISIVISFDLTIIHDNDVHSRFDQFSKYIGPCKNASKCFGGAARRATKVKELRDEYRNSLYLCAGDQFQGTAWYSLKKWKPIAEMMKYMKYDDFALGNHEFDDGLDGLVPFMNSLQEQNGTHHVTIVNTNIHVLPNSIMKTSMFTPWHIHEFDGTKVAVLGYTLVQTPNVSSPGNTIKFNNIVRSLTVAAEELKQKGINKIVALGHAGISADIEICKTVPGIDVVVGGHSNTFLYTGEPPSTETPFGKYPLVFNETGSPCLVVTDFAHGKYLGFLKTEFNEDGILTKWDGNPILLDSSIDEDLVFLQKFKHYKDEIDKLGERTVLFSNVALCSFSGDTRLCRVAECNLGNLVADSFLAYYVQSSSRRLPPESVNWSDVGIAIINGGGVRSFQSLPRQNISFNDVLIFMPFQNTIRMISLTGKTLYDVFEHSVGDNSYDEPSGRFLQVSGIRVTYDLQKPVGERVIGLDALCTECGIPKYEKVNETKVYNVVTLTFLVNGGDGYDMLRDQKLDDDESEVLDSDMFLQYVENRNPITVGIEGRILYYSKMDELPITTWQPGAINSRIRAEETPDGSKCLSTSLLVTFTCIIYVLIV